MTSLRGTVTHTSLPRSLGAVFLKGSRPFHSVFPVAGRRGASCFFCVFIKMGQKIPKLLLFVGTNLLFCLRKAARTPGPC